MQSKYQKIKNFTQNIESKNQLFRYKEEYLMNSSVPIFHYHCADVLYRSVQPASLLDRNMDKYQIYLIAGAVKQPISSVSKKKEGTNNARNYSTHSWVQSDAKTQTSGNFGKTCLCGLQQFMRPVYIAGKNKIGVWAHSFPTLLRVWASRGEPVSPESQRPDFASMGITHPCWVLQRGPEPLLWGLLL